MKESEAGGGEHAGFGVDGFAEVLGADTGVVAAVFGDDTLDMQGVGGKDGADIIGGEEEEALEAVLLLGAQGGAALAVEQGIGGPGGAPEDTGGVGAGGHGVEVLVELGNGDFLGFVDGEQQVGSGANDLGTRFAGEELQAGLAELVDIALGGLPQAARADTGIQGKLDAVHVIFRLGFEGGRDGDDAPAGLGGTEKQPGEEVGLDLILAGLAGKDDDKGEAEVIDDGVLDGADDLLLIGTQGDAAGLGPGDGTLADGLTDTEGDGGFRHIFHHLFFTTKDTIPKERGQAYHEGKQKTKSKYRTERNKRKKRSKSKLHGSWFSGYERAREGSSGCPFYGALKQYGKTVSLPVLDIIIERLC